jgi:hypothetical protein
MRWWFAEEAEIKGFKSKSPYKVEDRMLAAESLEDSGAASGAGVH